MSLKLRMCHNQFLKVYNREKSVCKRTTEDRTIDVFATGQKILVNYGESKMVTLKNGVQLYLEIAVFYPV